MTYCSYLRSELALGESVPMSEPKQNPALERERVRLRAVERTTKELAPVVSELQAAGYGFKSLDELRLSHQRYEAAVPILLHWLPRVSSEDAKETIVRTLSVPWAKPQAGPALIRAFKDAPQNQELLRWAIGNAIEVVVDSSLLEDIAEIVGDRGNGKSREMFALALGRIPGRTSVEILLKLLEDEEVAGHAIIALRKLKAVEALDHLGRFADHPKTWVRNEAKKAIGSLTKTRQ
jgi:hypothetical protein